ncbi:JmjC domain-containing histone demethylation protein 1 [Tulasnella sp. 417]|nr:JmjC domain-containing histone demethylation protein 1 [Tulasnella sp. 417]
MHVDFAGSSVFYHVLKGSKVFYFIRPTKANLNAYEKWCGSELQSSTWLGDLVDEVVKVELQQGNTMFIPTGWIHAVYTPIDSLVIGGNFLHSYNISTQLKVRDIEIKTRVPKKFRMCWYVGEAYTRALRNKEEICPRILPELRSLSDFLISEARLIESTANDSTKKETRDMVPPDKVPDAPALARELRWRLRLLLDGESGDEKPTKQANGHGIAANGGARNKRSGSSNAAAGNKRKRLANDERAGSQETMLSDSAGGIFRNYTPRPWESVKKTEGAVSRRSAVPLPEDWEVVGVGSSRVGELETRRDSVVKVRRVEGEKGKVILERETIVRTKEVWCAEDGDVMQME